MSLLYKIGLCILLSLQLIIVHAKLAEAQRSDFQSWTMAAANISLDEDKKWFVYAEAQPRIGNDITRMERLLTRAAFGYNLTKDISLFLGGGWTPTYMDPHYESDFRNEVRIWQQVLIKQSLFGLDWQHRLREEQRLIDDASNTSNRFRYLLRGSYKFCDCQDFGLTGYNEVFVTFNTVERGPRAGFDRDRFFFGPFWVIDNARYEVGYLGEFSKRFGGDDRMINALMLSGTFNF